ncbi:MAG: DUF975 family protein [Ruminococcaceae bacterium]|nr:DUF975 family protein [Oscillospiraceae bacterium]
MTSIQGLKKQARENMKGKCKTMGLVYLTYLGISLACSLLAYIYIGAILRYILIPPFVPGMKMCFLQFIRQKPTKPGDILQGIGHTSRAVGLYFVNDILIMLWSLLLLIPGFIKQYSYRMSFYVLGDHPEMTQAEAREESIRLMDGNKLRLLWLDLSFLGWIILGFLTCGILLFWVIPYTETAYALFYEELTIKKPRYGRRASMDNSENI